MLGQGLNYISIPNLSGLLYNYVNFDLSIKKMQLIVILFVQGGKLIILRKGFYKSFV